MTFKKHRKSLYYRAKRIVDIIGSIIGLAMLLTILPVLAILVKIDSKGPLFFFQTRAGQYGRKFKFIKLRTMIVGAHLKKWELDSINETGGLTFKSIKDPRITKIGMFLRRTSLDEAPQFWNVLKGEMSLVGPRPPLINEVERYNNNQRIRLTVPQGMSGLWQVKGRSLLKFNEMVDLDIYYAQNATFMLDIKIILKTIPSIFAERGAH
jgi:lipopolysaccharide/colanic/teichoic acid biosynthesis glycosyltransferase